MMEYDKEYETLKDGGDWWKPTPGIYKVTFLENVPQPTKHKFLADGKEKEVDQSEVLIEVEKKRYKWSITKANGKDSLWGQLMFYGMTVKDVVGKIVTVIIQGTGKQRTYVIQETLELKQKQQQLKQ